MARPQDRLESLRDQLQFTYRVPVHIIILDVRNIGEVDLLPQQLPPDFAKVPDSRRLLGRLIQCT